MSKIETSPPSDEPSSDVPDAVQSLRPWQKLRRWVARIIALLVAFPLLVYLGFIVAMQFVDFNTYKPLVAKAFFSKTGYKLAFDGDLTVQVLPFSLQANQVRVVNPEGFSQTNIMALDSVHIELSVWDLLVSGKLSVLGLELEHPQLNLQRLAQGKTNWSGLLDWVAVAPQKPISHLIQRDGFANVNWLSVANAETRTASNRTKVDWHLGSLVVRNGEVRFEDALQKGYEWKHINVMAFELQPNQPFQLLGDAQFDSDYSDLTGYVNGQTYVRLDPSLKRITAEDWLGFIKLQLPESYNVPEVRFDAQGTRLSVDFARRTFELVQNRFKSLSTELLLDITASDSLAQGAQLNGHVKTQHLDIKKWARHLGVALPPFVNDLLLTNVNADFDWRMAGSEQSIENLTLDWDDSVIKGHVWQKQLANQTPEIRFNLNLNQLNLDAYQAKSKQALQAEALSGRPQEKLQVNNYFQSGVKTLSTDNQTAGGAQASALAETAFDGADVYLPIALPISLLRAYKVAGQLEVDSFKGWGLQFNEVNFTVNAEDGQWAFAPLDAKLYGGQLRSKLLLDVSAKTPSYSWTGVLENVDLAPFLKEGWRYKDLSGRLNSLFNLQTQGVNGYLLKQNMAGKFLARVDKGAYLGTNLTALLKGGGTKSKSPIQLNTLAVDGTLKAGQYQIKTMQVATDTFTALGLGKVNLVSEQVDARLYARFSELGSGLGYLKGVEVPFQIKGTLSQPSWSVNLDKFLQKNAAKLFKQLQFDR